MYSINKGDKVIVVSGRKIPIGTKGTVFWVGTKAWGESVGIELENGNREFTAMRNVNIYPEGKKLEALVKCIENSKLKENVETAVENKAASDWGF